MDRENANFDAVLDQLKSRFGPKIAPVYLPIGSAEGFKGYVDVIEQHANIYEGGTPKEAPIPDELRAGEEQRREALVEAAAEASDELMTKYLEGEEISDAEIEAALHKGTREGSVVPVFVGSALKNIGVRELTTMIAKHVPSAAEVGGRTTADGKQIAPDPSGPFVAQVFKTTADPFVGRLTFFRVVSGSLKAQDHLWNATHKEEERIGNILGLMGKDQSNMAQAGPGRHRRRGEADQHPDRRHAGGRPGACAGAAPNRASRSRPCRSASSPSRRPTWTSWARRCSACSKRSRAMRVHREDGTGETILTAMGDSHVDVIVERLKRKFGASVQDRHAARAVPRNHPQAHQDRQPIQAPDRRPRPVRPRGHRVRADGIGLRLRVRQPRSWAGWCRSSTSPPSRRACARRWARACWPATRWST